MAVPSDFESLRVSERGLSRSPRPVGSLNRAVLAQVEWRAWKALTDTSSQESSTPGQMERHGENANSKRMNCGNAVWLRSRNLSESRVDGKKHVKKRAIESH